MVDMSTSFDEVEDSGRVLSIQSHTVPIIYIHNLDTIKIMKSVIIRYMVIVVNSNKYTPHIRAQQ